MPHPGAARWYRTGLDRWTFAVVVANLGFLFGVPLLVSGIAHAEIPQAVAGAAVLLLAGVWAYGLLRAGIGVTATHILIRSALG
jgi:hypothetical protein